VSVDLRVAAAPEGALTTHSIEITPKKFLAKLMARSSASAWVSKRAKPPPT
jgi:hypothetical protein